MAVMDESTWLLAKQPREEDQIHSRQDENLTQKEEAFNLSPRNKVGLVAAFLGILLANADTSLVWATHETVGSQFDKLGSAPWLMTSFTIGYCVTLPLYGQLSDAFGRLRPLVIAYCLFCAGCTISGFGQTFWQVVLGRVVAGFGGSGMISLASIIITDIAPPSDVAILRSYVNVAAVTGMSLGGPFGGFLTGALGWRWSFLCQVPVAVVCCMLIKWSLQDVLNIPKAQISQGTDADTSTHTKAENYCSILKFDFPGAISIALAVSSLLIVIDLKNTQSWTQVPVLATISVGAVSVVVFFFAEQYPGRRKPLIPLWLLSTEVGAFCASQMLILGGRHAFVSHIAPYFSRTQGLSDAAAGSYIIPTSVGNAIGAIVAGQAIKSLGSYKKLSLVSLFMGTAVSIFLLMTWSHNIGPWEASALFPAGFFAGMVLSTQFIGLSTMAPKEYVATAISMYYMSQQIGIAMGISISSGLLQLQFKTTLLERLGDVSGFKEIIANVLSDSSFTESLPTELKLRIWQCYLSSFWVVPAIYTLTHVIAIIPMVYTTDSRWD